MEINKINKNHYVDKAEISSVIHIVELSSKI